MRCLVRSCQWQCLICLKDLDKENSKATAEEKDAEAGQNSGGWQSQSMLITVVSQLHAAQHMRDEHSNEGTVTECSSDVRTAFLWKVTHSLDGSRTRDTVLDKAGAATQS